MEYRRRWFIWTPGRNVPFALLGYWRYHRVTLDVPFCRADRTYFARRWVPMLTVVLLAVVAGVATHITTDVRFGRARAEELDKVIIPAVMAVLAALYVAGWFVRRSSIRVVDVAGQEFTLANVSDELAAAAERGPARPVVRAVPVYDPPVVTAVEDNVVTAVDDDTPPTVLPVDTPPRRRPMR